MRRHGKGATLGEGGVEMKARIVQPAGFFYSHRSARPRFEQSLLLKRVASFAAVLAIVSVTIAGRGPMSARAEQNPAPLDAITSKPPVTTADPTQSSPPPLLTAVAPPANLSDFVQNETALLKLGKALFWDMQLGSDGIQACASCHFHAGADNRAKNQISPGLLATQPDTSFSALLGGGPNYQLVLTL
jgi:Di-haem cytochrome c peroxidase